MIIKKTWTEIHQDLLNKGYTSQGQDGKLGHIYTRGDERVRVFKAFNDGYNVESNME